jgi:chaperonin GroES
MNIRPLHDRILVERLEEGEQHIGGIIIPDTAKEKPQQGTVIAAGNGRVTEGGRRIALDVKAGDLILFGKYAGQEVQLDGKPYLIMKEEDALAVSDRRPRHASAGVKGQTSKTSAARTARLTPPVFKGKTKGKTKGRTRGKTASKRR